MVRTTGEYVCLCCVSVCRKKEREGRGWGDEAMSPAGVPPCCEQIAWALKGLTVSGVPSPPRTGRQGFAAQRTGGMKRREAGCWL